MKANNFLDIPCENRLLIRDRLDNIFFNKEGIVVVQLGASVGGTLNSTRGDWCPSISDPVWKFLKENKDWRGFLFEPHIKSFLSCKEFYKGDDNVSIFPVAVSSKDLCFVDFYERNAPTLCSMTIGHRKEGEFSGAIKSVTKVPNINIDRIIEDVKPDWLQVDIEGEDVFVIKSVLLNSKKLPSVISFEWCLSKEEDIQSVYELALDMGYSLVFKSHWDVIFTR